MSKTIKTSSHLVKKNPDGTFKKGNKAAAKAQRELSKMNKKEEEKRKARERAELYQRVKAEQGQIVAVADIEKELRMSDGATAIERCKFIYKRIMHESALIEEVNWNDPKSMTKRLNMLKNLRMLVGLMKDMAAIQAMAEHWEGKRATPAKIKKEFNNKVSELNSAVSLLEAAEREARLQARKKN